MVRAAPGPALKRAADLFNTENARYPKTEDTEDPRKLRTLLGARPASVLSGRPLLPPAPDAAGLG